MEWFHRNLTWPVVQNTTASAIGAILVVAGGFGFTYVGGCSASVKAAMVKAEAMVLDGKAEAGRRMALDGETEAPRCGCTHAVKAAADFALMKDALADDQIDIAESLRSDCFAEATRAIAWFGQDISAETLRIKCRASDR